MLPLETISELCRETDLSMVVLFGSCGRNVDSDWDLALMPRSADADAGEVEEKFVRRLRRDDLDFLWLPTASPLARSQVALHGEPLFQSHPHEFSRFRIQSQLARDDQRLWTCSNQRYIQRNLEGDWTMDRDLVTRKLATLARYLLELKQVLPNTLAEFETDFRIYRVAERQVELLVECAASINTEVAQSVARIPPSDYYSSFHSLAAAGWLDKEVALRLSNLAGLGNRLVHQYEDIRLPRLYKACRESIVDWERYLVTVNEKLSAD